MINSLGRDIFKGIYFFEEEFGRINKFTKSVQPTKVEMIKDVLKSVFGENLDLDYMMMREDTVANEFMPNTTTSLPLVKIYYVSGVNIDFKRIIKEKKIKHTYIPNIIFLETLDTIQGSIIILEDFLTYFFMNELYVSYDKDLNKLDIKEGSTEWHLIRIQNSFLSNIINILYFTHHIEDLYKKQYNPTLSHIINLMNKENFPGWSEMQRLYQIIIITSLKRWIRTKFQDHPLINTDTFDNNLMLPLIATYLDETIPYKKYIPDYDNCIKRSSMNILDATKFLEAQEFTNLDFVHKHLALYEYLFRKYSNKEEVIEKNGQS